MAQGTGLLLLTAAVATGPAGSVKEHELPSRPAMAHTLHERRATTGKLCSHPSYREFVQVQLHSFTVCVQCAGEGHTTASVCAGIVDSRDQIPFSGLVTSVFIC